MVRRCRGGRRRGCPAWPRQTLRLGRDAARVTVPGTAACCTTMHVLSSVLSSVLPSVRARTCVLLSVRARVHRRASGRILIFLQAHKIGRFLFIFDLNGHMVRRRRRCAVCGLSTGRVATPRPRPRQTALVFGTHTAPSPPARKRRARGHNHKQTWMHQKHKGCNPAPKPGWS